MNKNHLHLTSPTRVAVTTDLPREVLEDACSYTDKRLDFQLKQVQNSVKRLRRSSSLDEREKLYLSAQEALQKSLEKDRLKTLLEGEAPNLSVPAGLARRLVEKFNFSYSWNTNLPEPAGPLKLFSKTHPPRNYQRLAIDELLLATRLHGGPCGIELATGGGKTTVIREILGILGLGATVMAPSKSIAYQIFDVLIAAFGPSKVGFYGDGKKDYKKLITVGIDDSLTRVKPGSPAWSKLSKNPVFIADESHLCPSETLAAVCYGLAKDAQYRYFFSATQMRNDGLDLVLEGIIGRIVMRKDVKELVLEGYLARPHFRMVRVITTNSYSGPDANEMTRKHLYYNKHVNAAAGKLARMFVEQMRRPTVILVQELEQFSKLAPHLTGLRVGFAHGPLTAETKLLVPESQRDTQPEKAVAQFNAGELDVLVGTSCIATGTDIQVAEAEIYLMGGKSEIKVRQGVGRGTRGGVKSTVINPWTGKQKLDFVYVDFDVVDPLLSVDEQKRFPLHRHAEARAAVYSDIFSVPEVVDMTKTGLT